MLSHRSVISTNSSFAERQNKETQTEELQTYRIVGRGACGTIFEQTSQGSVLKMATESSPQNLWNDCRVHVGVASAFESLHLEIQIPVCHYRVLGSDTAQWDSNIESSPQSSEYFLHRAHPTSFTDYAKYPDQFVLPSCQGNASQAGRGKQRQPSPLISRETLSIRGAVAILHSQEHDFAHGPDGIFRAGCELLCRAHGRRISRDTREAKYDGRDIEFVLASAPMTVRHRLDKQFQRRQTGRSTWKEAMNRTAFTKRIVHL